MEKNNIKTNDRIKKWYWILIIIFSVIVLPFIFNKLILNERYWDVVGEGKDWLMFWPSYLSAIASAVMIGYTATTLKNNKEQLDELKRQWDEEHTPKVSVSFNFIKPYAYLRFDNISNVEVKEQSFKNNNLNELDNKKDDQEESNIKNDFDEKAKSDEEERKRNTAKRQGTC